MRVILASQSPRRAAILELANIDFEVIPSQVEEEIDKNLSIEEMSESLAYQKAKDVLENTQGDRAIIGADTIVVKDNKIFGKPKDRQDAIRMLKELQGATHQVFTGLSILIENQGKYSEYKEVIKTEVKVNEMSDEEIIDYVDNERPLDKAGAYAIQSSFAKFITNIKGNYMSVVGLPVDRVYEILKENEIL